jgi:hypothetical protein
MSGFVFQFKIMCFQLLKRPKGGLKSKTMEEKKNSGTIFNFSISRTRRLTLAFQGQEGVLELWDGSRTTS